MSIFSAAGRLEYYNVHGKLKAIELLTTSGFGRLGGSAIPLTVEQATKWVNDPKSQISSSTAGDILANLEDFIMFIVNNAGQIEVAALTIMRIIAMLQGIPVTG